MPGKKPVCPWCEAKTPMAYHHLAGTIRAITPEQTLAKIRPLYSKIGITRIANISALDLLGLPVVSAIRPNAKNLSISLGKGISFDLAEISAVMESFEGYHAENLPAPTLQGAYTELISQGSHVVDPLPLAKGVMQHPNIREELLAWIAAENLADHSSVYVPYALINLDLESPRSDAYYFQVSSNGLASGNTLEEATCHALYELIERDAFYEFGLLPESERNKRLLDLSSIDCDAIQTLLAKIKAKSLSVKIWEITHQMGVPSFHCCLYDESLLSPLYFSSGTGSHFCKEVALLRALTEAIQGRTALVSGTRDDIYPNYYLYQKKLLLERNQGAVHPTPSRSWIECLAPSFSDSFADNVHALVQCMKTDVYRVNLTREELAIPVVFVVAPGLNFTGMRM